MCANMCVAGHCDNPNVCVIQCYHFVIYCLLTGTVVYTGILFGGGGVQQIQLRTEGGENGDVGLVAP
jgi:hypothetical protein